MVEYNFFKIPTSINMYNLNAMDPIDLWLLQVTKKLMKKILKSHQLWELQASAQKYVGSVNYPYSSMQEPITRSLQLL